MTTAIVESPLQVLCANEARHQLEWQRERTQLLVLTPGEARAREQIDRTIALTGWDHVERLPARSWANQPARWSRVHRLARQRLDDVWIGDYSSTLMRKLAGDGQWQLLDDGMATLFVNEARRLAASGQVARDVITRPPWKLRAKRGVARAAGLRRTDPSSVRFFTMYDLDVAPGDSVARNRFTWLRENIAGRPVGDHTLFLGSSFADFGGTDLAAWAELTREACAALAPPVEYLPHRRESEDARRLVASEGVQLSRLTGPIEADMLTAERLPRVVAAFFSTALHTLSRLLPPEVEIRAFRVPEALTSDLWRERLRTIYSELPDLTDGRVTVTEL